MDNDVIVLLALIAPQTISNVIALLESELQQQDNPHDAADSF